MASTFELIEERYLTENDAAIDFTNVTQAYEHLQIRVVAKSTYTGGVSDDCRITFNRSGTIGSWDQQVFHNQYSTAGSFEIFGTYDACWMPRLAASGSGVASHQRGTVIILISDYANTSKRASIKWYGGNVEAAQANQSKQTSWGGGVWSETTAISEIRIQSGSSGLRDGTSVAIYGMKSS